MPGLIFDSDGARLSPTHAVKKGKRYRYYVSTALITRSRSEHPKGRRIPAGDIEGLVLDRLRALFASGAEVSDAVAPLGLDAATQRAVLDRSAKLAERSAETENTRSCQGVCGWGTWIRTKIDGVRVRIEPLISFTYFANWGKNALYASKGYESFANRKDKVVRRIDIRDFGQCGRRKWHASILADQTGNVITHPAFKYCDGFVLHRRATKGLLSSVP